MSKMFKGLDQQGRYPEASEAATEVGTDDDALDSVNSLVLLGLGIVALVFAIAIVVVVLA